MNNSNKLSDFEVRELACYACGLSERQTDDILNKADGSEEEMLIKAYGVDIEQYSRIVTDLIKFTPLTKAALGDSKMHAFVRGNVAIARVFVEG